MKRHFSCTSLVRSSFAWIVISVSFVCALGCDQGDKERSDLDPGQVPAATDLAYVGPVGLTGMPHRIVFDPSDDNRVWAGSDDTGGVYLSTDGGTSWTLKASYGERSAWALDVDDRGRVYAGDLGTGLRISTDAGETWSEASEIARASEEQRYIRAISVDLNTTRDTQRVFAAADGSAAGGGGGLWVSENAGANWTRHPLFDGSVTEVYALRRRPGETATTVLASYDRRIYRSIDNGSSWTPVAFGDQPQLEERDVYPAVVDFVAHPTDPSRVLAAVLEHVRNGESVDQVGWSLWGSGDAGATWQHLPGAPSAIAILFGLAAHPRGDYFVAFGWDADLMGVMRSSDDYATNWTAFSALPPDITHFHGAFKPDGSYLLMGSESRGITKKTLPSETNTNSSAGMSGSICDGFAISPGTPERWFATCTSQGKGPLLTYSDDEGTTWIEKSGVMQPPYHGEPDAAPDLLAPLLVPRSNPNVVILGGYDLRRSVDRGTTWTNIVEGAVVFSLAQASNGTLYAAATGKPGVLKSMDEGATWSALGELGCNPELVRTDPHDGDHVFAGCSSDRGGYKHWSGSAWVSIPNPPIFASEPNVWRHGHLSVDPFHDGGIAVAVSRENETETDGDSKVYYSPDLGATWVERTPPDHPRGPGLTACAVSGGLLHLSDRAGHLVFGTKSSDAMCPDVLGKLWESFDNGVSWRNATRNLFPSHVWQLMERDDAPGHLIVSSYARGFYQRLPLEN